MNYDYQESWVEGYLSYLLNVERKSSGTMCNMKCTFRNVITSMEKIVPGKAVWECRLDDYMEFVMNQRDLGKSETTIS